jgi:hypothetical protein
MNRTTRAKKKQLLARVVLFIKVNLTPYRVIAKVASKGVSMIRLKYALVPACGYTEN